MKLFQRLLVAPAALGLLSPLAANATEVNLNAISKYSGEELELDSNSFKSISTEKSLLISGGEGLMANDSDSFSTTTTASFSADFAIGAVDGGSATTDDAVMAGYGFQIDLNTSFTGEDSFDVSIDAGNAGTAGISEFDLNSASETLTVDGISYTFPVGGATLLVGDTVDGSSLFTTACAYGGPSNTLDDCGNVNAAFVGSGTTLGASYDFDNGFTTALGYAGAGDSTDGLMTKEGADSYGGNVAYTADTYAVSVTYAMTEDANGVDDTYTALNAYWTPDGFPSISAGYEWGDDGSEASTADELTSYFFGIQSDFGPGTIGAALGTKTPTVEGSSELLMYEAFYSYDINDGMTITPLVYVKEFATGTDDETGLMVKTSFSF
jgi:hypothetical protein